MSPATDKTTIKTRKTTAAKLRVLRSGGGFATLDALLDHLARVCAARPELLKERAP